MHALVIFPSNTFACKCCLHIAQKVGCRDASIHVAWVQHFGIRLGCSGGTSSDWGEAGCSRWQQVTFSLGLGFYGLSLALCACCYRWWESDGGEETFSPIFSFVLFLLCVVGEQPVACQGLPGHLTCSQSASHKPLLCSVLCQTWCFRSLVWLHVWRGSVTMRSSCWWHLWCQHDTDIPLTARDFPGDEEEQQLLGWYSPAVQLARSSLHCLGSACHQQREMPM